MPSVVKSNHNLSGQDGNIWGDAVFRGGFVDYESVLVIRLKHTLQEKRNNSVQPHSLAKSHHNQSIELGIIDDPLLTRLY